MAAAVGHFHETGGAEDPQLLVAPEHIALRVGALGEQAVRQPHRLHRLAVIDGFDLDTGLLLERLQQRFREILVLRAIGDNGLLLFGRGEVNCWQQECGNHTERTKHQKP